jgi:hypothetical protein
MQENFRDFQIGNWVIDNCEGNYCTIKSLSPNIVLQGIFHANYRLIEQIGKIKITRDKLQVLGFTTDSNFFIKRFSNEIVVVIVFLQQDSIKLCRNTEEICDVQFIHEVQNAYYAITGELIQGNLYGVREG